MGTSAHLQYTVSFILCNDPEGIHTPESLSWSSQKDWVMFSLVFNIFLLFPHLENSYIICLQPFGILPSLLFLKIADSGSEMTSANPICYLWLQSPDIYRPKLIESSMLLPFLFSQIWACSCRFVYQFLWEARSPNVLLTCQDDKFHLKLSMSLTGTRVQMLAGKEGRPTKVKGKSIKPLWEATANFVFNVRLDSLL